MKKYILFDNDGVLVETQKWYHEANTRALGEIDIELSLDAYMQIMISGRSVWEIAHARGFSQSVIEQKRAQRDLYYQEFLRSEHIETEGVTEVLKELSKEYKMGIVTTSHDFTNARYRIRTLQDLPELLAKI
ncbi:MAG: hypothetical protein AUK54_07410 [Helicobacteraceae bacterium CG2_30_36_10]|nr:MAG: hypothetical protein AUK54_07410 [Helicobacteraceae bacterium CG2_30_36_10]